MEPSSTEPRCLLLAPCSEGEAHAPLFGLTAVERTVLAFRRAGVREFWIVGEPAAAATALASLRAGPCRKIRVRTCDAALPALPREERFFVARTDCYYDRRLVARFVAGATRSCGIVVAVDLRADALTAHAGAARVALLRGLDSRPAAPGSYGPGRLRCVGRGLVSADGVLAGLALGTSALARALDDFAPDASRLARALTFVAEREPIETFAVAELWQELTEGGDFLLARRKVLAGAVGIADGVIARHVNRPISRRITERLLLRDVKPWQMSLIVFALTLAAGGSFAVGHAGTGGMLAQLASVMDGVDGELASVRYQDSPFGGVYDALLDRVGDAAVIGGMTLYAWAMGAGHSAVVLGFAAVAGSSLSMLVKEKYGTQFRQPYTEEREGRFRWLLLGRDGRLFLALVAGLTGHVEAVLAYIAVGTHVHAGLRIYRIRAEALAS